MSFLQKRYYWLHGKDQTFQLKVSQGVCKPFPDDTPALKATTRGIALNLTDLTEFLEAVLCSLLLNTIVKKEVKKWVHAAILFICNDNQHLIPKFFDVYKNGVKKDFEQSLKTLLSDFLTENPDVDTIKLTQEMPVIISLLELHREVGLGPM